MLPDRSLLFGHKVVENAKSKKIQMRHFEYFSNNVATRQTHSCVHLEKKRRKIHEVLGIFGGDLQHGLEIYLEDYMYNIRHFSALEF